MDELTAGVVVQDLVAQDLRVARVAFRLKTANLPLCARHGYDIGIVVQAVDAYARPLRPAADKLLKLGKEPGIAAVIPGGPAALAGLRAGDRLLAADDTPFAPASTRPPRGGSALATEMALDVIDRAASDGRVRLSVLRDGHPVVADVTAAPSCAGRVQLMPSHEMNAWSDDRYATITTAIARDTTTDDDLALVMGHELAHLFLGHEALLDHRGRGSRLVLETERDADYLGLYLAARAGFSIADAPDFWRRFIAAHGGGSFLLRRHPGGSERIRETARTIAEIDRQRRTGRDPMPQRPLLGSVG